MTDNIEQTPLFNKGYRVVDLREPKVIKEDVIVTDAHSVEDAAKQVLGLNLTRSGKARDIRARVYFYNSAKALTMVRLYRRVSDPE